MVVITIDSQANVEMNAVGLAASLAVSIDTCSAYVPRCIQYIHIRARVTVCGMPCVCCIHARAIHNMVSLCCIHARALCVVYMHVLIHNIIETSLCRVSRFCKCTIPELE